MFVDFFDQKYLTCDHIIQHISIQTIDTVTENTYGSLAQNIDEEKIILLLGKYHSISLIIYNMFASTTYNFKMCS